ncbi:MAG: trk system potassium uptake protein TrkH [Roseivirga sp.]|jgi:trk system potassium uptake protein TrkH
MSFKRSIYKVRRRLEQPGLWKRLLYTASRAPFWLSLLSVLDIVYYFGFEQSGTSDYIINTIYIAALFAGAFSLILRYLIKKERPKRKAWKFDIVLFGFIVMVLLKEFERHEIDFFENDIVLYFTLFWLFVRELAALNINFKRDFLNPAQLFVLSFSIIILIGSLLLMLPKATHEGLPFIDALFTATSAVCVTGLVVVDTGQYFTVFGQSIILVLIQIGGLGIMTFTSYFSYFFRGDSSYENQLQLKEMTNTERIADVFSTLKKIILLTVLIEAIGVFIIFNSLDETLFPSFTDRTFFSVFHSISAFCNAGFSTLSNSMYEVGFKFNYPLHLVIAFLFIIGGLGFPIIFNGFYYVKHLFVNRIFTRSRRKRAVHLPWVVNINTRIVLITTAILIVSGTVMFYFFEYNNTLEGHSTWGKMVTAFFGATTPRTAGFNSIDTSALAFPTIMLVFLLMWIGASPGSTGGGIKTSTIAVATLNYFSIARGKDRVEIFNREIGDQSIKRAFAIISLSLVVVGFSTFCISYFDSEKSLKDIAFECFSAYSTSGLSLGITSSLTSPSKLVIIATMFVGRVSMLTILIAVVKKVKYLKYKYPTEEISIN